MNAIRPSQLESWAVKPTAAGILRWLKNLRLTSTRPEEINDWRPRPNTLRISDHQQKNSGKA